MAVAWTRHRFSGGALALDVTNTVVRRGDAARSFDRFDDAAEIVRFAEAASRLRADELGGRALDAGDADRALVIRLRESCDRLFRARASNGEMDAALMPDFLRACADGLEASSPRPDAIIPFPQALATSALALLPDAVVSRIRICPSCGWLFLDKSRNSSRLWCDMTVCGNRSKAQRHYRRRRIDREEIEHA